MRFEEPEQVGKICKMCGKLDMMNPRGVFCDACKKERARTYNREKYWKHREQYLERIHAKRGTPKTYAQHEKRRIYPVIFNCKDGRYSWAVSFKNPLTNRTVMWQSDGDFSTLRDAQKDFSKACGR